MKADEIQKLEKHLRRTFQLDAISIRKRPQKDDSAEVYIDEEFVGIVFRDDEEEEDLSWNFQMAILEFDLEDL